MKRIIFMLLAAAILASCSSRKNSGYTISGIVKGADTGFVYLRKIVNGDLIPVDSAAIKNGKFTMEGKIGMPERYILTLRGLDYQYRFFVENAKIDLTVYADSTEKLDVTGSATQDIYKSFNLKEDTVNQKMAELDKLDEASQKAGDTAAVKKISRAFDSLDIVMKKLVVSFARDNAKSVVAPYLIIRNFYRFDYPELKDIAAAFDTSLKASDYYQAVEERLNLMKNIQIGMPAVDFTLNDTAGKPVALSSLKGKILLVDFWASWCRPCRMENPNVVKAYKGYNRKGFDVLGVSLDKERAKWVKAINDDGLTWNHVSDLKGWGNQAAKLYAINSIPSNVLIDMNGVIIGRDLRGEGLEKKLAELLGPPAKEKSAKPAKKK
jgi:peroxiredoxin